LFNLIKKLTKETELFLWLSDFPLLNIWRIVHARGVANFIRWSSSLRGRGRHRTMATNPVIKLGGNRAHAETTVLTQLKKSQQNRATAFGSCQITAIYF
jgi:hypothetical protein